MLFPSEGFLVTDKKANDETKTWTTQSDWEAYQEKEDVAIPGDYIELVNITLIDDFEHNDLSGSYDLRGHDSMWEIQTSVVYQGTYALRSDSESGDFIEGTNDSLPGFRRTPEFGDTFEVYMRSEGNNNRAYFNYFRNSDAAEGEGCYELTYLTEDDSFRLRERTDSGVSNVVFEETLSTTVTGDWIRIELTHEADGTVNAVCETGDGTTLATASATEDPSDYTSGGGIEWGSRNTVSGSDNYYGYSEVIDTT